MLPQKGNQDIEDPFAAFFSRFQLKTPAYLFKEGTMLLMVYTAVFETFSAISPLNQLSNATLLQQVNGHGGYSIITFSHDYQTTHSKAFIQFNSNGQPGEITLQIRHYGSSYVKSDLYFLFYL